MSDAPQARARLAQELFGYLDEYRPGLQAAVESRVTPEYMQLATELPPTTWVPFELTAQGVEAAIDVLGIDHAADLWRKAFVHRFSKTPVIGGLIAMWTRLFGLSPGSLVKAVPRGFEGSYRNLMSVDIEVEDARARIDIHDLHPVFVAHDLYLLAFQGTFEGVFDLCHVEGTVNRVVDLDHRRAEFTLQW